MGLLLRPVSSIADVSSEQIVQLDTVSPQSELKSEMTRLKISPEFLVSAPQPLLLGIEGVYSNRNDLRFYLDAGYFQFPLSISSKGLKEFTIEGGFRYQPFHNALFLSLGFGYRKIDFETNFSPFSIDNEVMVTGGELYLSTFYVSPMIEGRFKISERFSMGCGIGVQIPVIYSGAMDLQNKNTGADSSNSNILAVDSGLPMSRIAGILIPRITLFQLVWNLD